MSYIMYIDESYDSKSKYIIMTGFIVPLEKWKELEKEIKALKIKYFSDDSINLKIIRRKNYDKDKHWESLPSEKKRRIQ